MAKYFQLLTNYFEEGFCFILINQATKPPAITEKIDPSKTPILASSKFFKLSLNASEAMKRLMVNPIPVNKLAP